MSSISIWDDKAALESCWFDCESYPTSAYNYPSNDGDFIYLTGYRDDLTRAEWYENVLFFSCLSGCRSQLKAERWLYILVPVISAIILFLMFCCCITCKGCPLARWYRDSRASSAKIQPKQTAPPNPFLVSSIADFDSGYGYNSLGFAHNPTRRRVSTLDRKYNSNDNWGKLLNATADNFRMQNMENTMVSLSALPRAPPAALYNPLEHGNSFRRTEDTQSSDSRRQKKSSSRKSKSSRIKVARVN